MIQIIQKEIAGSKLTFTNQAALYWAAQKVLIVSDLHVGKAAHFRKHGIAIPSEILHTDLRKLEGLMRHFDPDQVMIVGDLFHAGYNSDLDIFKNWRKQFPQIFTLISGNHDRLSAKQYQSLGIDQLFDNLKMGPFTFIHEPKEMVVTDFYISGHIHPGYILQDKYERLRLPCFAVSDQQIILPAFSYFTGLDTGKKKGSFKHIVFTEDTIMEF